MKRCNNCGWYNLDTATSCEKCGESLAHVLLEPEAAPEEKTAPEAPAEEELPKPPVPSHPMAQTEPKVMNRTVRMDGSDSAPARKPAVDYGATIRDVSAVMAAAAEEPKVDNCPKCHYPLSGSPEFCPNCGTPIRKSTRKDARQAAEAPAPQPVAPAPQAHPAFNATIREGAAPAPKPQPQQHPSYKATIREGAAAAMAGARPAAGQWRLVPVQGTPGNVIYLEEGDVVSINGQRYRFEK